LSYWSPDDDDDSKEKVPKWNGLVGDLFIRALKCVVLPLVFINVIISVVDMMTIGKAGSVGWKTIVSYLVTTVIASILGIISIVSFKSLFQEGIFPELEDPTVSLGCNEPGFFLAEGANGSVSCNTADIDSTKDKEFYITDISGTFVKKTGGAKNDISLSDTIYEGVFTKLVTDNILASFVGANFAAVVFYAIVFGVALSKVIDKKGESDKSVVMCFFN
jgi:Na+/H+-dicarboxylate symporter